MTWRVETLNDIVDRELDASRAGMRAPFARICGLIAAVGLQQMAHRMSGTSPARCGRYVSAAGAGLRGRSTSPPRGGGLWRLARS